MNRSKKGFTLAELLIVVAIIGVLVAISIPIFNKQLEKGRETVDLHSMRSAKSLAVTAYYDIISNGDNSEHVGNLMKYDNGSGGIWYQGWYNPKTGSFVPQDELTPVRKQIEGKGTEVDTGTDYEGKYNSSMKYTDMAICVQIVIKKGNSTPSYWKPELFPSGNDVGIHIQWRDLYRGNGIRWEYGYDFIPAG